MNYQGVNQQIDVYVGLVTQQSGRLFALHPQILKLNPYNFLLGTLKNNGENCGIMNWAKLDETLNLVFEHIGKSKKSYVQTPELKSGEEK
jgi:hypothetical protein